MAVDCSRARSSDLEGPVTELSLGAWYVAGDDIHGTQLPAATDCDKLALFGKVQGCEPPQ